ncbi:Thioredoxin domain-containing protein 3 [Sparganum proliferum]
MLKNEKEAFAGFVARIEVEDLYLKAIEEAKEAEAKRKSLEMEIDQESTLVIISPAFVGTDQTDAIVEQFTSNDFEILVDETRQMDDDLVDAVLSDEIDDPDFGPRLNVMSKGPARLLIVAKGPQGVHEAIVPYILTADAPSGEYTPPADGEEAEPPKQIVSIQEAFGGGDPKAVIKFWKDKSTAESMRAKAFPDFVPAKVIVYRKEEVKEVKADETPDAEDEEADEEAEEVSSDIPDYGGPPRSVVLVRPSANAAYRNDIIETLKSSGFEIQTTREFILTEEAASEFYEDMASFAIFNDLIKEMTSGPILIIVAAREDAYKTMRELLGPESFSHAQENSPQSLRAMFSSIPDVEKGDDMTWIDATLGAPETQKQLLYFFPIETTFALIKPESVVLQEELLEIIRGADFKIAAKKEHQLTPEELKVIYERSVDKPFYDDLVDYLSQAPSICLILKAQDGVEKWRALMGCADPDRAVDSYPDDLRAVYGRTSLDNAVHGSSSVEHAKACIELIFGADWDVKKKDLDGEGEGEGDDEGEGEGEGDDDGEGEGESGEGVGDDGEPNETWEDLVQNRPAWRREVKTGAAIYESNRTAVAKLAREARKSQVHGPLNANHPSLPTCPRCQRAFARDLASQGKFGPKCAINPRTPTSPSTLSLAANHPRHRRSHCHWPAATIRAASTPASTAASSIIFTTSSLTPSKDGTKSDVPSTSNITSIPTFSDMGPVHACPHCNSAFTSHIGLVSHLSPSHEDWQTCVWSTSLHSLHPPQLPS